MTKHSLEPAVVVRKSREEVLAGPQRAYQGVGRSERIVVETTITQGGQPGHVTVELPEFVGNDVDMLLLVDAARRTAASIAMPAAVAAVLAPGLQELTTAVSRSMSHNTDLIVTLLHDLTKAITAHAPETRAMTQSQRDWMIESGAMTEAEIDEAEKAVAAGELERIQLQTKVSPLVDSLDTADVAKRLGINGSRVRHRVGDDLLYSWKVGRSHRFPKWQFADDGKTLLPGLKQIVETIPDDLGPASVQRLMTSPQDALLVDGEPTSPREWLLSGHDVEEVVELIEGIDS